MIAHEIFHILANSTTDHSNHDEKKCLHIILQ